jgi:hypothetical protein
MLHDVFSCFFYLFFRLIMQPSLQGGAASAKLSDEMSAVITSYSQWAEIPRLANHTMNRYC